MISSRDVELLDKEKTTKHKISNSVKYSEWIFYLYVLYPFLCFVSPRFISLHSSKFACCMNCCSIPVFPLCYYCVQLCYCFSLPLSLLFANVVDDGIVVVFVALLFAYTLVLLLAVVSTSTLAVMVVMFVAAAAAVVVVCMSSCSCVLLNSQPNWVNHHAVHAFHRNFSIHKSIYCWWWQIKYNIKMKYHMCGKCATAFFLLFRSCFPSNIISHRNISPYLPVSLSPSMLLPSVNKFTSIYSTGTYRQRSLDFRKTMEYISFKLLWMNEWMNISICMWVHHCQAVLVLCKICKMLQQNLDNTIQTDEYFLFFAFLVCARLFSIFSIFLILCACMICVHVYTVCVCVCVRKYFYKLFVLMTSCCPSLLPHTDTDTLSLLFFLLRLLHLFNAQWLSY